MSYTPPIFATDSTALPSPLLGVPAAGSDGTDARVIATDTSGRQKVLLYDSTGVGLVADSSGNLKTAGVVTSGGVVRQEVKCNLMAVSAIGTTTPTTVVTGAPGYAISGVTLSLNNPIFTSNANLLFQLSDSSSGIVFETIFPAYTVNNPAAITVSCPFFWNNRVANSHLSAQLNASLVAGNIVFNVNYAFLPYVG